MRAVRVERWWQLAWRRGVLCVVAVFRLCSVTEREGLLVCAVHCSPRHPRGTCRVTSTRPLEGFQASTLCIGHGIRRHGIRRHGIRRLGFDLLRVHMERHTQGSAMPRMLGRAAARPPPPHFLALASELVLRATHVDRIRRSAEAARRPRGTTHESEQGFCVYLRGHEWANGPVS